MALSCHQVLPVQDLWSCWIHGSRSRIRIGADKLALTAFGSGSPGSATPAVLRTHRFPRQQTFAVRRSAAVHAGCESARGCHPASIPPPASAGTQELVCGWSGDSVSAATGSRHSCPAGPAGHLTRRGARLYSFTRFLALTQEHANCAASCHMVRRRRGNGLSSDFPAPKPKAPFPNKPRPLLRWTRSPCPVA